MLIYTGRATLVIDGKPYQAGNVVPLSQQQADRLAAHSNAHSFEPAPGPKPPFPKKADAD